MKALGLLISYLKESAKQWYETHIRGKNWKYNNLLNNLGIADLNTIWEINIRNNDNQIYGLNTTGEF